MAKVENFPFPNELYPEDWFIRLGREDLFPGDAPIELDLGCGDGSFLMRMARHFPKKNFLGVERLLGRVRKVSRYAKRTFVVLSNDSGARSLVNAFQMQQLLGLEDVRAPRELVKRFPQELIAVRPDRPLQVDLFGTIAA